jgi:hypothetical protein
MGEGGGEVKDTAICSVRGDWCVIGKYDGRKAFLTLKGKNGSIILSEKDLKPIVTILDTMRTLMSEERNKKEAARERV